MPTYKEIRAREKRRKLRRKGFRGYPVATVAFYGPDDQRASKMVVSIVRREGANIESMRKWYSAHGDVRTDREIQSEMLAFCSESGIKSMVTPERIIGCPHEEGIDYPEGEACPECPFWKRRDRFTGKLLH